MFLPRALTTPVVGGAALVRAVRPVSAACSGVGGAAAANHLCGGASATCLHVLNLQSHDPPTRQPHSQAAHQPSGRPSLSSTSSLVGSSSVLNGVKQQQQQQQQLRGWQWSARAHPPLRTHSSRLWPVQQQQQSALPLRGIAPSPATHLQQQLQQQQHAGVRRLSDVSEAARRRLVAAHQRRQREEERERRLGGSGDTGPSAPPPAAAGSPEQQHGSTALAPVEQPLSESQIAEVVQHPALIVARGIEWGTVILGFEQATKYTVYDQDGEVVALIAEEISGIGNEIQRQVLRTHRSFASTVLSADGSQVVFRVRRPAYLINSYMYIEDPQGQVIGEVRQRWHPWRRKYDLFLGRRQFAAIDGGFLAWEFELKDGQGNTLALIDRNFLGFTKEILTDAGKYVVHYGYAPQQAAAMTEKTLALRSGRDDVRVTPLAQARTDVAVIPSQTGNQLLVQRPLPMDERMVALAAAISVDYNFFSTRSGGFISPPLFMPLPGGGGGGGGAAAEGGAAAGAGPTSEAAAAAPGDLGGSGAAAAAAGNEIPGGGFGSEFGDAGGSFGGGFGPQQGGGGGGFGDDAESFKWDDLASGATGGGGGGGGEATGLWGFLLGIWAMIVGE